MPNWGRPAQEADSEGLPAHLLLDALWRKDGSAHLLGILERGAGGGFKNLPTTGSVEALASGLAHSANGLDVYFACAEYANTGTRKADNALRANAFWMDLDCGADKAASGKGYLSVPEAEAALQAFCAKVNIPTPTHVVRSGGGLHVYWATNEPVEKSAWQASAQQLKALAKHFGLIADPTRTADIASVLRMPGTLNHKSSPGTPVILTKAIASISRDELLQAISTAHAEIALDRPAAANTEHSKHSAEAQSTFGPPNLPLLESAFAHLDADCDEETWKLKRLAPLARAARDYPEQAADLKMLAMRWSRGDLQGKPSHAWTTPGASSGITGEAAFLMEWDRFLAADYSGAPVTLGTILHDAQQAGWDAAHARQATRLQQARRVADALLTAVIRDCGAPLQDENIAALRLIQDENPADFQRIRAKLKSANKDVSLSTLDRLMRVTKSPDHIAPTHHGYAMGLIKSLTVGPWKPVGHEGSLFVLNAGSSLWVRKEPGALEQAVAEAYDGNENCTRRSDYSAIALHATSIVGSESFFAEAPVGLACAGKFYRLDGEETIVEPLSPSHRQRVCLSFEPTPQPTPMFDAFLHETFKAESPDEEQQQIALVQEVAGAVMLGLMHRHHKAVLFYDPYGRAGKGTLESIIRQLNPPEFITAVSPFAWNKEYFVVALAGARLNVVGELPDDEPIPAAIFKSVIGGDLITGRNPTHRPISFKNEAAHIFTSNHLIHSRDHSEAFFARWIVIEFPNSRLKSGLPLDPGLAERIIKHELPGIAYWALQGAARLLRDEAFSRSQVHERQMGKWRRSNSSLEEFIEEACDLADQESFVLRAKLYQQYRNWCADAGRRPFTKSRVKELLEHNVALGVKHATLDGYEIFRGLTFKPTVLQESEAEKSIGLEQAVAKTEVGKVGF